MDNNIPDVGDVVTKLSHNKFTNEFTLTFESGKRVTISLKNKDYDNSTIYKGGNNGCEAWY